MINLLKNIPTSCFFLEIDVTLSKKCGSETPASQRHNSSAKQVSICNYYFLITCKYQIDIIISDST